MSPLGETTAGPVPRPLAVLIVAYRAVDKLELSLASVKRFFPDCPIHVWDNSGPDFAAVREASLGHPDIHWYLGGENIGFAAAVNLLSDAVPGYDMLLVNPDAEVLGPLPLTRAALQESGIAASAPMQWVPPAEVGKPLRQPWDHVYRKLTLANAFGNVIGFSERRRGSRLSILYRTQPSDVDGFISGSCLAINREAWDQIGCFNEEFFMYQEEAEWQRRAQAAGWRVRLADEIGSRHAAQGTVSGDPKRSSRSQDLASANAALMVEYCFGLPVAEAYLAVGALKESLRGHRRGRRGERVPQHDVVLCVDGPADAVEQRAAEARRLLEAGYSVCVVSLQRLGSLQRELPPGIRLIRRPWWMPSITGSPSYVVGGATRRERAFTRLFRLSHRSAVPLLAIDNLATAPGRGGSDAGYGS